MSGVGGRGRRDGRAWRYHDGEGAAEGVDDNVDERFQKAEMRMG